MTNSQKNAIRVAIEREIESLGSAAKVANKCQLNQAYISFMRNTAQWKRLILKDEHWIRVAKALGVKPDAWQIVETMNTRTVVHVMEDAKERSMFMAISYNAGSGKTANAIEYAKVNKTENVFYFAVNHADTNKVQFIRGLGTALGLDMSRMSGTANILADSIIEFFVLRLDSRPLLIVDEADKLTDQALKFFITLYNAVEGRMGCVIMGTENLQKKIKRGVKNASNGFDEIDSRFGRRYIGLQGVTKHEAMKICDANGVSDKQLQAQIFEDSGPVTTVISGRSVKVLNDLRPLVRLVQREKLRMEEQAMGMMQVDEDVEAMEAQEA
ncbi:MAG: ATP-binding protein [Saprospiraceae bacterium]|nr:ATP-binding protein [Saprospiraceae bacterium]